MTAVAQLLDTVGALVNTSNAPTFNDINSGVLPKGYQFPQSSTKPIVLKARAEFFSASTATLKLSWYSLAGSVTGNVTWQAEVAAVTPGDAVSVEGKGYATAQSATSAANATARGEQQTSITLVNLDSLADNDDLWIRISRTDTSMVGDAVLFDATLVYDDGQAAGGDVVGAASATDNAVARFDLATGKLLQNSVVVIDDSGNITGVGTLNTRVLATLATGPGSSTAGRVATFVDAGGLLLANGPRLEADLVAGPASATDTALMRFSGTGGKTSQNSGITVDASNNVAGMGTLNTRTVANFADGAASSAAGNIASFLNTGGKALQDSGVSATAHAARHNPAGADPMFTGTWAANEAPVWNGTIWVPKIRGHVVQLTADFAVASGASTLADITGLTFALPRAGTYAFQCAANHVSSGTAGLYYYAMNYTGTVTRIGAGGVAWQTGGTGGASLILVQAANNALVNTTTANGGTSAVGSGTATLAGSITVSTTGTLSLRFARANASTAVTIKAGAFVVVDEQ
jgi:hypothetical protein